jgi:diguanylate cyclase (GGDEF)-like protein
VANATARTLHDLAEEIRRRIEALHVEHNGQPFSFTASLGVAHVRYDYEMASGKEIIERADECLYDAKRGGRNRVEITF